MRRSDQLSIQAMVEIIGGIQQMLWLDVTPECDTWNSNKEWDSETLEYIAATLADHGLAPEEEIVPVSTAIVVDRCAGQPPS